jgi:hypothetical protein
MLVSKPAFFAADCEPVTDSSRYLRPADSMTVIVPISRTGFGDRSSVADPKLSNILPINFNL